MQRDFCPEYKYLERDVVDVIFGLVVDKFITFVVVDVPPLDDTITFVIVVVG